MWLTCCEVTELATDASEGRLSTLRRLLFVLHRLTCRGCRVYLGQLASTTRALGRLDDGALSDDKKRQLLDALAARKGEHRRR